MFPPLTDGAGRRDGGLPPRSGAALGPEPDPVLRSGAALSARVRALLTHAPQWIYGKGYPRLRATLLYNAASGKYSLAVEQTQRDEKKGIGVFACDLEVDVGYADAPEVRLVLQFDEFGAPLRSSPVLVISLIAVTGKATAELPNKARPRWVRK